MKKILIFIFLALNFTCAFADVYVAKNKEGEVTVTFFYANPRATEVLLAGDFTNWQNDALIMEKKDDGYYKTITVKETDKLRFKYISDGNWTSDLRAPDFVDDGFGGKNGYIDVTKQLKKGKKQIFKGKYKE